MWPFNAAQMPQGDELLATSSITIPPTHEASPEPTAIAKEEDTLVKFVGYPNERLSIPLVLRAPILGLASFTCGFTLGASKGAMKGAYCYRAENAHRLPTTQTGWFLYQKSKNYHAMLGGMKEGIRFGSVCTGWATLFMLTEELIDQSRARLFAHGDDDVALGQRDAASTVIAGLTVAGIYSWKSGFDHFATAGTARVALRATLAYGLVQDLASSLRGNPPAYVSWLKRKMLK